MGDPKYLLESFFGFLITSPLLDESIKTVLNYDNSLLFWKIIFLVLFWVIDIVGYIAILDGLTRFFFDKNLKETIEELND